MKIGVLGTGDVGRALADAFIDQKHEVRMGSRNAGNEKAAAWAQKAGKKASLGTFGDAAGFGELIVIATLGTATEDVLEQAGPANFDGKLVLDTTNPLDFSGGMPPKLSISGNDSLGERVQRALPGAHVVKCFNTVGNVLMYKPKLKGGPPTMFIAGNNEDAKKQTTELLTQFGWETSDIGGIESSRYLEAMCLAWVLHGIKTGSWGHAFKLLS
jgi:predicted dinucleotide-binding enzyme